MGGEGKEGRGREGRGGERKERGRRGREWDPQVAAVHTQTVYCLPARKQSPIEKVVIGYRGVD